MLPDSRIPPRIYVNYLTCNEITIFNAMLKKELLFYISPSVELVDVEVEKSILQDSPIGDVDSLGGEDDYQWN